MDLDVANIVGMRLKVFDFFHGVVIVNPETHIVGRRHKPLFPRDKFGASDGEFGNLKRLYVGAGFIVPNGNIARVESGEGPGFGGVDVNGFDAFRAYRKLLLDV